MFALVIPQLVYFGKTIISNVPIYTKKITEVVYDIENKYPSLDIEGLAEQISNNVKDIGNTLAEQLPKALSSSLSSISGTINGIINFCTGIGFAVVILTNKDRIRTTLKKVLYTYLGKRKTEKIIKVFNIFIDSFSNFVVARNFNSYIVGILCIFASIIFRIPNAIQVGIVVGVTSLIPIFGAIIGIAISLIMIIAISPIKALIFLIISVIIWQLGENIILPYFIGKRVGMSDVMQFIATVGGGSVFGVLGIILGVPIVNTAYVLITEKTKDIIIEDK